MPKRKRTITPSTAAIHAHIQQNDSTHGPAPEASAALLIRLLRSNYPSIKTGVLTDPLQHIGTLIKNKVTPHVIPNAVRDLQQTAGTKLM